MFQSGVFLREKGTVMIPWVANRMRHEPDGHLFTGEGMPIFNLVTLLWEIEQNAVEKHRLMLLEAPSSVVYHGYGDALYLFRQKSRVPFVSFGCPGSIASVGFRYNDPVDPASGCRKSKRILTGWQGVAELIAAAVRRSAMWKDLETIEVSSETNFDRESVTYDVWATPRYDRLLTWSAGRNYHSGSLTLVKNRPLRLASVNVDRQWIEGQLLEEVALITLYPDVCGYFTEDDSHWESSTREDYAKLPAPLFIDLSHECMMRMIPHDGFEINWS